MNRSVLRVILRPSKDVNVFRDISMAMNLGKGVDL